MSGLVAHVFGNDGEDCVCEVVESACLTKDDFWEDMAGKVPVPQVFFFCANDDV